MVQLDRCYLSWCYVVQCLLASFRVLRILLDACCLPLHGPRLHKQHGAHKEDYSSTVHWALQWSRFLHPLQVFNNPLHYLRNHDVWTWNPNSVPHWLPLILHSLLHGEDPAPLCLQRATNVWRETEQQCPQYPHLCSSSLPFFRVLDALKQATDQQRLSWRNSRH